MALRVTRQTVEVLSRGPLFRTITSSPTIGSNVAREVDYNKTLTSSTTFTDSAGGREIEESPTSSMALGLSVDDGGPQEIELSDSLTFSHIALYPVEYDESLINSITVTSASSYTKLGNSYETSVIWMQQFLDAYLGGESGVYSRGAANTVVFGQSVDPGYEFGRKLEHSLAFTQHLELRPYKGVGTSSIAFTQTVLAHQSILREPASSGCVVSQDIEITYSRHHDLTSHLTQYSNELDEDGNLIVIAHGIESEVNLERSLTQRSKIDCINFTQLNYYELDNAAGNIFDYQLVNNVTIGQEYDLGVDNENIISFTHLTDYELWSAPLSEIVISQSVTLEKDSGVVLTQTIPLKHTANYELINDLILCTYAPLISTSTDPDAPIPPSISAPTLVSQDYVRFNHGVTDLDLRLPELGDRNKLHFTRINRETRGGTLQIFSDPIWPQRETLHFNFIGLSENEMQSVLDFVNISLGTLITFYDWHGRTWQGIITNPDLGIIRNNSGTWSITIEMEGNIITLHSEVTTNSFVASDNTALNKTLSRSFTSTVSMSGVVTEDYIPNKTYLIHAWHLNETSGVRYNSVGDTHLTDMNTVGYATGKVGNCAHFIVANYEYLSHTDDVDLEIGDNDWQATLWIYFKTVDTQQIVIGKYTTGQKEYILYNVHAYPRLSFVATPDASTVKTALNSTFGNISAETWYFVSIRYDKDSDKIGVNTNCTGWDEAALIGGVYEGTANFELGRYALGSYLNGYIDSVHIWKGALLSNDQLTYMYNSGNGREVS